MKKEFKNNYIQICFSKAGFLKYLISTLTDEHFENDKMLIEHAMDDIIKILVETHDSLKVRINDSITCVILQYLSICYMCDLNINTHNDIEYSVEIKPSWDDLLLTIIPKEREEEIHE